MLFITLQQQIYRTLTEAGLTVYDSSEKFKELPCVVLFSPSLSPLQDKTSHYHLVEMKFMIVTEEKKGKRQLYETAGELVKALRVPLQLDDAIMDQSRLNKIQESVRQADGLLSTSIYYHFSITTKEEI